MCNKGYLCADNNKNSGSTHIHGKKKEWHVCIMACSHNDIPNTSRRITATYNNMDKAY